MTNYRKTIWAGPLSSLILMASTLAACNTASPAEQAPPAADIQADRAGDETQVITSIDEIFSKSGGAAGTSNGSSDALPADSEVDAKGIPVGFTENGNPYRGNPNAPVVLEEFSDFQ